MKILAAPIETAVWFKLKEKPYPIKFRYSDREGLVHKVNVGKIISIDETKRAGIRAYIYRCQSEIDGIMKAYELKYLIDDCRWELYKM
ncbi:MAG: hypothetical protein ACOX5F_02825 [Anaerovoracaceae bacterium]|jgi:hypothetical protein